MNRVVGRGLSFSSQPVTDVSTEEEQHESCPSPHCPSPECTSDVFQARNDDGASEPSFYSINQMVATAAWSSMRIKLLRAMTETQGMPENQPCSVCQKSPAFVVNVY